jgi:MFS transporter, DHA1 family, staphyloferrin A biosynthesis exporter
VTKTPGRILVDKLRRLRTFDSFSSRAFRFFFFSMMGQSAAQSIQQVANPLLAYRLTGSAAILGLISLVSAVPTLILSLFGGVVADRISKKYLLEISQLASVISSVAIAVALATGYMSAEHHGSWWVLMVNSVFQGIVSSFAMPAGQSIIPELVKREQVMNAVSLNNIGSNAFRLIAPVAGGFLIDAYGFAFIFYIMAGLYVVAAIMAAFIPHFKSTYLPGRSALADVMAGIKYVRSQTPILLLLGMSSCYILLFMPFQTVLAVFTDDVLEVGASGLGLLMSVSGAGALAASIVFASLPGKRRGLTHLIATLVTGIAMIVFAFTRIWPLSITLMIIIGIGQMGHVTTGNTLFQTLSDPRYLGRVMSILMMNSGIASLGTFAAGLLIVAIGAPWAIGGFAIVLGLVAIAGLIFAPRLRKLD